MKRKPTVTIGTAAYNEAENIELMLRSILSQEQRSVRISKVIVVSDGSSDDTAKIARSISDSRITVVAHTSRRGQPSRLNEVFRLFRSDFVIMMDADTVFANEKAVENIIKVFKKSSRIGAVAGNTVPVPGRTFLEKAINNYIYARQKLQNKYNFGKKALVAHAYLAFSRELANQIQIPKNILNSDGYCYFECIRKGYRFSYAHNSIVYYRSASQIKEYINQATRHLAGGRQLGAYFGDDVVAEAFSVPFPIMGSLMLYQMQKSFVGYLLIKILFSYSSYRSKRVAETISTKWERVNSTKNFISKQ